jgi:circadian clock protein KaiC
MGGNNRFSHATGSEEVLVSMSEENPSEGGETRLSTGTPGLDNVLCGGLDAERLYLVEGEPGTGKTTLALQFLLEGAAAERKACM